MKKVNAVYFLPDLSHTSLIKS